VVGHDSTNTFSLYDYHYDYEEDLAFASESSLLAQFYLKSAHYLNYFAA
jgi:hypothetical protein